MNNIFLEDHNIFLEDRRKAFTDAVMKDDWKAVKRYCRKYQIPIPSNKKVMKAGIYKAAQECTDLSEEVKAVARRKCIDLGFMPFMR